MPKETTETCRRCFGAAVVRAGTLSGVVDCPECNDHGQVWKRRREQFSWGPLQCLIAVVAGGPAIVGILALVYTLTMAGEQSLFDIIGAIVFFGGLSAGWIGMLVWMARHPLNSGPYGE